MKRVFSRTALLTCPEPLGKVVEKSVFYIKDYVRLGFFYIDFRQNRGKKLVAEFKKFFELLFCDF